MVPGSLLSVALVFWIQYGQASAQGLKFASAAREFSVHKTSREA